MGSEHSDKSYTSANNSNHVRLEFEQLKLCGRKRELGELMRVFEECTRKENNLSTTLAQAPVVVLEGHPGCGKTRLVQAFRNEAAAATKVGGGVLFLYGRYQEEEEVDPFGGDSFLALTQAMDELVNQLSTQEDIKKDHSWRDLITQQLTQREIQMLGTICPQLTAWLWADEQKEMSGPAPPPRSMSLAEASVSNEDASKTLDSMEATLLHQSTFTPAEGGLLLGASHSLGQRFFVSHRTKSTTIVSECSVATGDSTPRRELSKSIVLTSGWRCKQLGLVCRSLFRTVSQKIPVVLCQDNLQGAHPDYWSVISEILGDVPIPNLMFVGIDRRDNNNSGEREDGAAISGLYGKTASAAKGGDVTRITLDNFELSDIEELLLALMGRSPKGEESVSSLARVLQRKTNGNPAVLVRFLELLEEKNLIFWAALQGGWDWDLEKILSETSIADGLVEGLSRKIHGLSPDLVATLAAAANIGTREIDFHVLHRLRHTESEDELRTQLDSLVDQGLLECVNENKFVFAHPRIQRKAKTLLDQENKQSFHALAGKVLMEKVRYGEENEQQTGRRLLLLAASHLNRCPSTNETEQLNLLQLNLDAAQVSVEAFSLKPAIRFLEKGRGIARGMGGWESNKDLMLRMELFCIQILYCSGRHEECCELADQVIEKADWMESLPALRCKVCAFLQLGRFHEAKGLIDEALRRLGFPFSQNNNLASKLSIAKDIVKIKATSYFRDPKKLLDLPPCDDPRVLAAMDLYWILFKTSLMEADSETQIRVSLSWIRMTLKHGLTQHAPSAIATLAMLHAQMKDYDTAQEVSDIALKMAESVDSAYRAVVFSAVAFFCTHWKCSLTHCLDMAVQAKDMILETGFTPLLYFSCVTYTTTYIVAGLPLEPLMRDGLRLVEYLQGLKHNQFLDAFEIPVQFISNMMGRNDCPTELSGEIIRDGKIQLNTRNERTRGVSCLYRMILGYIFDDIELAVSMSRKLYSITQEGPSVNLPFRLFFQGLVAFSQARRSGCRCAARARKNARRFLRMLDKMAGRDCVNICHYVLLLKAELLSIQRKSDRNTVRAAYDNAISASGRLGVTHVQAIGNELAAAYFDSLGDESWACVYMNRAWKLYSLWGAHRKAAQLQSKFEHLLSSNPESSLYFGSRVKGRARMGVPAELCSSNFSMI